MNVENAILLVIAVVLTLAALVLAYVIGVELLRIFREFRAQMADSRRPPAEPETALAAGDPRSRATRMKAALQRGATSLEGERERGEMTGE